MITTQILEKTSQKQYSSYLTYGVDGLLSGNTYLINLGIETQNPQLGVGMVLNTSQTFNVQYPSLRVLSKPTITQIEYKSALQVDWAGLYLNPGVITGQFSYADNFMSVGNTALYLNKGSTLSYNSTVITPNSTRSFSITMASDFTGNIVASNDGKYIFGYDLTKQMFYTIINGITVYSELIKNTINEFIITLLSNHAVIKQFNICNQVSRLSTIKVSDIYDYPIAFMIQDNN